MYAIYRERGETLIFDEGYWTTQEAAQKECTAKPQRHRLQVRAVPLLVNDVEVAGGRIERHPGPDSRPMYDLSARITGTDQRQCIGWYRTLRVALKKRHKYRKDRGYDEWIIERSSVPVTMWDDNVCTDTESV